MFSVESEAWRDEAVKFYREASEVLGPLRSRPILEHVRHAAGVVEVKYEGGASILINYTDRPVTVNGMTVEAQDFTAGGDEG
ncbi:hypothetical protein D1872_274130 [compost metagenome]